MPDQRRTLVKQMAHIFKTTLTDKELGNLKFHREQGTPILCGNNSDLFISDEDIPGVPPGGG